MDWKWLAEHAKAEWRVLTEAPVAAVVAAAVIAVALYGAFSWAYQSVFAQKEAAINSQQTTIINLNSTVSDLRDELTGLRARLTEKPLSLTPLGSQPVQRDPDGVYQFNHQVGSVVVAKTNLAASLVTFERIYNAANFDTAKDFEYRDLILHIRNPANETRSSLSGGPPQRAIWHVECSMVGRRPG